METVKRSKLIRDTVQYMERGRGKISVNIIYALESMPLEWRTFGNNPLHEVLNEETIEKKFGGNYLLTMVSSAIANRFLHAKGTKQTLYIDHVAYGFFKRHGLTECGIWDQIDEITLDQHISMKNHDARWAYSACKPFALLAEIKKVRQSVKKTGRIAPILFHDTDLILKQAIDVILGLEKADDVKIGFGHLEAVGKTPFYPDFTQLHFPDCIELTKNKEIVNKNTGLKYRTDLPAVNTCLMYFSDLDACEEWAGLFRDFMMDNWVDSLTWIKGEQNLLADDQRTCLMVSERRGLKLFREVKPIIPLSWEGDMFVDAESGKEAPLEWHYYRPGYVNCKEVPDAENWIQSVQHLWNQKGDIERHYAYDNYLGVYDLELMAALCPKIGIDWEKLKKSLRTFPTLKRYFDLFEQDRTLESMLAEEKGKRTEDRIIDDQLFKNLTAPFIPLTMKEV